ncbi:metal ABC transporter solute-binding protein, Zn/Mn family [Urbifossiella limnaea]|uniref:Periplasmic zinc-binding protein TroA n=1 Tax=Urbifossiella limnaea TaxID=2528023 RepID=A0A517XTI9_9BACT|nr:zinc ABC transporter substrate-binding protein [Urbifossiella limnaea]QDU20815.1 Periplasmic zinc-binding protein TroA precursor [Urbifossiella limnaea]
MSLARWLLVLGCGVVAGCGGGGPPEFTAPPVKVVCTTTIVADLVKHVGGDRVTVDVLMGPGVDPHRYIPTAGDRAKLEGAHLVLFNGLHLEGKMTDTFEKSRRRFRAFAVTRDLPADKLRAADTDGGEHDPHVWFDVKLWAGTIGPVQTELSKLDPAGAATYSANAEAYRKELDVLDGEVRAALGRLPKERRVLVTGHDAFGYFGQAYGVEVRGLQGVSTASEVGTADLDRLADFLGSNRIPAVFTETSIRDDGLQAVLENTRKKYGHSVRLVGGDNALYSDALGAPGTPGGTYAGMVRHNVKVIVDALAN